MPRQPDDHRSTLDLVLEVAVLLNGDMSEGLAEDDLTPARARLVWELGRRGPSTQRDLADVLDVTPRNVTGLVDALVESGLVTRKPHPHDRRATLVTFTRKGAALFSKLDMGHGTLAELLFRDMEDRTFSGLTTGLEQLLVTLRALIDAEAAERGAR